MADDKETEGNGAKIAGIAAGGAVSLGAGALVTNVLKNKYVVENALALEAEPRLAATVQGIKSTPAMVELESKLGDTFKEMKAASAAHEITYRKIADNNWEAVYHINTTGVDKLTRTGLTRDHLPDIVREQVFREKKDLIHITDAAEIKKVATHVEKIANRTPELSQYRKTLGKGIAEAEKMGFKSLQGNQTAKTVGFGIVTAVALCATILGIGKAVSHSHKEKQRRAAAQTAASTGQFQQNSR